MIPSHMVGLIIFISRRTVSKLKHTKPWALSKSICDVEKSAGRHPWMKPVERPWTPSARGASAMLAFAMGCKRFTLPSPPIPVFYGRSYMFL